MLRALGADEVIDYTQQDVASGSTRYDLIFDVASTLKLSQCRRVLKPTGVYVVIGHDHYGSVGRRLLGSLPLMFSLMARSLFESHLQKPDFSLPPKQQAMDELRQLLEERKLTPVIDRTFPMEAASEALEYLTGGSARGRVLITP